MYLVTHPFVNFEHKNSAVYTIDEIALLMQDYTAYELVLSNYCLKGSNLHPKERKKVIIAVGQDYSDLSTVKDVYKVCSKFEKLGYTTVALLNQSTAKIFTKLKEIYEIVKTNGSAYQIIIYVAGHGCNIGRLDYYDCLGDLINVNCFINIFMNIEYIKVLLFYDACRVGEFLVDKDSSLNVDPRKKRALGAVVNVIKTCSYNECAYSNINGCIVTDRFLSVVTQGKSVFETFKMMSSFLEIENIQKYFISPHYNYEGSGNDMTF